MKTFVCLALAVATCIPLAVCQETKETSAATEPTPTPGISVIKFAAPVYPPIARTARIQGEVRVLIEIAPDGSAKTVTVLSGHPMLKQAAADAVKQWKFGCSLCEPPLLYITTVSFSLSCGDDGALAKMPARDRVTVATSCLATPESKKACLESLSGFPSELATVAEPPFPADFQDVTIVYFESGCFGKCPSFKMTMRDGAAEFEGHAYVRAKGKRKARLDPKTFERLVRAWFDARLYAMKDDYCAATCPDGTSMVVTDIPESSIELTTPKFKKQVYECYTTIDGKPITPKPPAQYFELRRELAAFAKSKGWL